MNINTEHDGRTVANILKLIHYQRTWRNENTDRYYVFLEIRDSDLIKLSGLAEISCKFMSDLNFYLTGHHCLSIKRCGNSWLLGDEELINSIECLPPGLIEAMSPGFISRYFEDETESDDGTTDLVANAVDEFSLV